MKRRYAVVGARADVRVGFYQRFNHGRVGIARREVKRRHAAFVARLNVRVGFYQRLYHSGVVVEARRYVKRHSVRRFPLARAGIRASLKQRLYHSGVGIARRRVKRRQAVFVARLDVGPGRQRALHFQSGSAFRRLEQIVRRVGMNGKRRQGKRPGKQDHGKQAVHRGVPFKVRLRI